MAICSLDTCSDLFDHGMYNFTQSIRFIHTFLQHQKCYEVAPLLRSLSFIYHVKSSRVTSGDCGGQFYKSSQPIHQSGNYLFRYSITDLLKCWGSTSVSVFSLGTFCKRASNSFCKIQCNYHLLNGPVRHMVQ